MPALSDASYRRLFTRLQRLLEKAKRHKSTTAHLVETYWTMGQLITEAEVLESASWGDRVVKNLSEDLSIDARTLQRSIAFSQEYEELPQTPLGWSHYRELLTISDPEERAFYEKLAIEEELSRDRLAMAIESDVFSEKNAPKRRARLRRPSELRYLFDATVVRVIDGDTMVFDIDVEFEVVKRQRIRLSSVNAFSADSKKGALRPCLLPKSSASRTASCCIHAEPTCTVATSVTSSIPPGILGSSKPSSRGTTSISSCSTKSSR